MKYSVELLDIDGKPLQVLPVGENAGDAILAFNDATDHPFAAGCALVSESATGQRMTMKRH